MTKPGSHAPFRHSGFAALRWHVSRMENRMPKSEHESESESEYGDAMVAALELIWGEGFLSPGGPAEVAEILAGIDIGGKDVLDIGCGIGGADFLLVRKHEAASVLGIDVEAPNIERARMR